MLPGYLFYSFEEIHVIDNRYFTHDIVQYVREHHITDILFANNIFSAYLKSTCNKYRRFIKEQPDSIAPEAMSNVPEEITEVKPDSISL